MVVTEHTFCLNSIILKYQEWVNQETRRIVTFLSLLGFNPSKVFRSGSAAKLSYTRLPPRGGGEPREGGRPSNFSHHSEGHFQWKLAQQCCQLPHKNILLVRLVQVDSLRSSDTELCSKNSPTAVSYCNGHYWMLPISSLT